MQWQTHQQHINTYRIVFPKWICLVWAIHHGASIQILPTALYCKISVSTNMLKILSSLLSVQVRGKPYLHAFVKLLGSHLHPDSFTTRSYLAPARSLSVPCVTPTWFPNCDFSWLVFITDSFQLGLQLLGIISFPCNAILLPQRQIRQESAQARPASLPFDA